MGVVMLKKNYIWPVWLVLLLPLNVFAETQSGISLSIRLLGNNWSGDNTTGGSEFEASEGKQLAYSVAYYSGKFFAGLNLQGGTYKFGGVAPDQVTSSSVASNSNVKIKRNEIDLVAGYFLTNHISLFLDIKGTNNSWVDDNYEQGFAGIGLGIYTVWPIGEKWNLQGSFGFVSNGKVTVNGEKAGDGTSGALEFGAMYNVSTKGRINFGLKSSSQTYTFDSGYEQTHKITGLFLGYSHSFSFN